jgi:hypothetical protein
VAQDEDVLAVECDGVGARPGTMTDWPDQLKSGVRGQRLERILAVGDRSCRMVGVVDEDAVAGRMLKAQGEGRQVRRPRRLEDSLVDEEDRRVHEPLRSEHNGRSHAGSARRRSAACA